MTYTIDMTTLNTSTGSVFRPIVKFGSKWICEICFEGNNDDVPPPKHPIVQTCKNCDHHQVNRYY